MICDIQQEYSEHLLQILAEQFEGEYQFHLFHDSKRIEELLEKSRTEILLIGEECEKEIFSQYDVEKRFILTGIPGRKEERGTIPLFRYQSAQEIVRTIRRNINRSSKVSKKEEQMLTDRTGCRQRYEGEHVEEKQGDWKIRDEPVIRGLVGIYSPVHRIGKTKFAIRLGQKMARQVPVLYLNMEGYSGGAYYFKEETEKNLGDLFYFIKQDGGDCGLKLTAMTAQKGGMDYILPMKNEQDVRSVKAEEWISLLDMIVNKCIYEVIILDLGDAVNGLYDILRKCDRIYTPYICEGAAEAKLEQYENNLRAAGYEDILRNTVKRQVGKGNRQERWGSDHAKDRNAV